MRKLPGFLQLILPGVIIILLVILINAADQLRISFHRKAAALEKANFLASAGINHQAEAPEKKGKESGETASSPTGNAVFANAAYFDPAREYGGRLTGVISSDTANMNYLINNDAAAAEFNSMCNSSLAERDYRNPSEFVPAMAESWLISRDKKSYFITLRENIFWHDFTDPVTGEKHTRVPVTADDFKFFVDVVKNPGVNCESLRVYYQDIDSVEIFDDRHFAVRWKKPYYGSMAATLGLAPLPRHLYHAYGGDFDPVKFNTDNARNRIIAGCGPYRFERWEKDKQVVFRRNENYFGNRYNASPAIDTVIYELIKHPATQFQALLSGRIDTLGLSPDKWLEKEKHPQFSDGTLKTFSYPARSFFYIGYNLKNPLFQDKRIRQALTMLTDREAVKKIVFRELCKISCGPYADGDSASDPEIKPWPYDPAAAGKLLAECGWTDRDGDGILEKEGRKFEFTILQIANHPIQQKMLPLIKESFAAAGINMQIQTVEWSVLLQRLDRREFEACTLGWSLSYDPDLYQLFHSSQAELKNSSNFIAYANPEADRLIEELRAEFDQDRRRTLNRQLHRILHDDQPYTFLVTPYVLSAVSGRYRNVRKFPGGIPRSLFWTPKNMQRSALW